MYEFNGLESLFHEYFHRKRCAIAVEKELGEVGDFRGKAPDDARIVEIGSEADRGRIGEYTVRHRDLKCRFYLKNGYKAVALVRGGRVVGDIWYADPADPSGTSAHPDMEWLNLPAGPEEAYTFDMFLDPKERGSGAAAYLQHQALLLLKGKGFRKAFGYFQADNIPALWVHRLLKWKEIKKVYTNRFIRRWVVEERP
jgi:GNAT superfamily N-acetyltransferase